MVPYTVTLFTTSKHTFSLSFFFGSDEFLKLSQYAETQNLLKHW